MDLVGASVLSGTVTLLLADLEGSVPHWEADPDAMTAAMDRVDVIVAATAGHHGGHLPLEQGEGDSFVVAFTNGAAAVACAIDLQRAFADEAWPGDRELEFRMGVHTGEVEARSGGRYVGTCVNRSARLRDLGHGGQTLVSGATRALVRDQLPTGAMLRYLGECELRGTAEPIEVYELTADGLRSDFPPLDVVSYVPLPATLTTFVGRSGERDEVRAQLADHRLVTVTGAGGSGKTRLALEVAAALPNALWADLAPLRRADLVVNTVADAIGISGNPDDLEAEIVRRIRSGAILLVLDNCEHLLDESARLAAALLERCPDLTVLATSREPLGIAGEAAFRIPSLRPAEASALFVDRAQLSQPGFELTPGNAGAIATICARLDGLPLAIELAASRTSTMGLDLIVDGLQERFRLLTGGSRDALPRQRTLEASVSWSYDLLGDAERTVFARLSVFAGSFDADAAAAVCAANGLARADVVDNLASLVDRSLVQVVRDGNTVRYRMLETIHVYARQRLRETDDPDATRERHLAWAKQLAVEGGLGFVLQTETWHPRLVAELDNLRAAISWALDQGRGDDAVDVIEPLVPFFPSSRMYPELDPLLRAALDAPRLSPEARLRALTVATGVAMYAGDFARGYELASEWVERGADHDDPDLVVMAHCMRAWTAAYALRGSNDQIRADLDLARAAVDSVQSPERRAELLMYIGSTEMSYESARVGRETLNRAIEVASTATGFTTATIGGRGYLIACAFDGKVEESLARADETVTMAHATGSDLLTAYALWSAGLVYTLVGREDEARRHITASFEAARRSRLELQVHFAQRTDAVFQLRFGEPEDALEAALAAQASARR